jgi:DNA-binding NarL/FixJ family response regulator
MVMPDGGGVEAARRIADCSPQTRSVMLTSFDGENEIRAALDAGIDAFFTDAPAVGRKALDQRPGQSLPIS